MDGKVAGRACQLIRRQGSDTKIEKDEGSSRGGGELQEASGKTESTPMAVMAARKHTLHPLIVIENGLEVGSLVEHCFSSKQYDDLYLASLNPGVGYICRHENRRSKVSVCRPAG